MDLIFVYFRCHLVLFYVDGTVQVNGKCAIQLIGKVMKISKL